MQKIPTVFVRDWEDMKHVTREVTPGCEWVLAGEGVATRKYNGTCVMFDGTKWWARRDVKSHRSAPANFALVHHDEKTGKMTGYVPIDESGFVKFFDEALAVLQGGFEEITPGTYELCGPKVNSNPEDYEVHELVRHETAQRVALSPYKLDTYDLIKATVIGLNLIGWEGIVWHHPDGRMAKVKARDFPLPKE